ncbi:hypothetical protein FHS76_003031 [Ochrobactrum daejeonense]|uniref:Lnb N-terminal periplasmic domain-containing protein n=2 Tax=Brucella daejeonensis TaxID=659015 RepID=A0A7W9AYX0_9HYPH|nr:DUF4105 domain-containing protein [Brucella daejeonensis]MBB5703135.1 hypothetical protein [Brucella daejeonensis]
MTSLVKPALLRIAAKFLFVLFALVFAIWASLAMWFQLPFGDAVRGSIIAVWLLITLGVIFGERQYICWRKRLFFCILAALMLLAWATVRPSLNRIWAPDVARTVTGKIDGDIVTLSNVRDFVWRTTEDFTPDWKEESYDLSKISTVDVYLSYWSGPAIAHTLLSFGFEDGRHVVFSGKIRREHHEVYSSIAGFFRKYELAMIAARERDIVYLRTNIRKENVYRYRVKLPPAGARELFLSYVKLGNELAERPKFYNTLTANCTTIIFSMARLLDPTFPFDYRILLSGYLPGYLYDHGWLENGDTLEKVREKASIDARALSGGRDGYSERIRE